MLWLFFFCGLSVEISLSHLCDHLHHFERNLRLNLTGICLQKKLSGKCVGENKPDWILQNANLYFLIYSPRFQLMQNYAFSLNWSIFFFLTLRHNDPNNCNAARPKLLLLSLWLPYWLGFCKVLRRVECRGGNTDYRTQYASWSSQISSVDGSNVGPTRESAVD